MPHDVEIRKAAFVGDYVPRKCGIATFTHDLATSVRQQYPRVECVIVPVNNVPGGYAYPPEVRFEFEEQDLDSYRRAADFLNFSNVDVVSLQHEFGIFGGPAGSHIVGFLRDLRVPVVTTLHSVLRVPSPEQRRVTQQLAERSARLVVMSERGKAFLREVYGVDEARIDVIAHGIPDMPFVDPAFYKDQFGVEGKYVALTFGLLSPNKGIEYVLRALPQVLSEFPNFVYIVLGATHPNLVREQGEAYRISLDQLADDLGIREHVIFYNRFVELHELTEFLGAADIYITPYLNAEQITSGTLAYAFGCGKAVISTPYWHAEELLSDGRGVLVPFRDSEALAREICALLRDEPRRHAMRKRAYLLGREMVWSHVAHLYMDAFQRARRHRLDFPHKPLAVPTLAQSLPDLPRIRLDHLLRLTDSTGMLQHARLTIPDFGHGYCVDDNARALVLAVLLQELGLDSPDLARAAGTYAALLTYAFNPSCGRFRNFLSFDRRWMEEAGSDDSLGRALWALGVCVGRSEKRHLQSWAMQLLDRALTSCLDTTSPRAWALSLVGIHEYLRRMSGDRLANQIRTTLTARLVELYEANRGADWHWFEQSATYENARLCQALLLSGRWTGDGRALEAGLESLRWLARVQRAPRGHFRPIGCKGFYVRGQEPAQFDQQPLEAQAMVAACIEAYHATGEKFWLDEAQRAFEWFLGRNDLGLPLYDSRSGGCRDGLLEDRLNENQGAESTLAFLLALAEMTLLRESLVTLRSADRLPLHSQADGFGQDERSSPHGGEANRDRTQAQ
jgi:glycosyltransferase involved in cell wall biosynthesis